MQYSSAISTYTFIQHSSASSTYMFIWHCTKKLDIHFTDCMHLIYYGHILFTECSFFVPQKYQIVIEEDLLLTPDFMPFMAQCMSLLSNDHTLAGASAWNINGRVVLCSKEGGRPQCLSCCCLECNAISSFSEVMVMQSLILLFLL